MALIISASCAGIASTFSICSFTKSGCAAGRSILLMTGRMVRLFPRQEKYWRRFALPRPGWRPPPATRLRKRKGRAKLRRKNPRGPACRSGSVDTCFRLSLVVEPNAFCFDGDAALASRSMESSTCSCISRCVKAPVISSKRSASVDLPWSMCAMIQKLRMNFGSMSLSVVYDPAGAS